MKRAELAVVLGRGQVLSILQSLLGFDRKTIKGVHTVAPSISEPLSKINWLISREDILERTLGGRALDKGRGKRNYILAALYFQSNNVTDVVLLDQIGERMAIINFCTINL